MHLLDSGCLTHDKISITYLSVKFHRVSKICRFDFKIQKTIFTLILCLNGTAAVFLRDLNL